MAACPKSRPQTRKRHHAEIDLSRDDLPLHSKKLKSTRTHHSTQEHHSASSFPPAFWDSLSKVWLTRRALRELDRRNRLGESVCAPTRRPVRQLSPRKDLQRYARLGGPELSDLRGYPEPTNVNLEHTMSLKDSSRSCRQSKSTKSTRNSTSKTSKTEGSGRRSSAYDKNFEELLINNGIYPKGYEYPSNGDPPKPSNLEEIRQRLAMPRPSLSPSRFPDSAFEHFVRANDRVIKEGDVMRNVLPTMCGNTDIPNQEDLLFTRLESMTNEATVDAQPDFYDGTPLGSINKQVQEHLGQYIIPTGHRTAPAAPNFFIEAKAPKGGTDVAKRQITYDLSLGARGMQKLQSYGADELVFDNKAYTLGATYHDGQLMMYATHVTPSGPEGSSEYHMTQLGGWSTTGDPDTCRRGAAALRHGRDQAQEWRNSLILDANERARYAELSTLNSSNYNGVSDTTDGHPVEESQTSTDEHQEPEPSEDELATVFYDDLSGTREELETSADELALDMPMEPATSKKRSKKESEKTVSKAPRQSISSARRKHRSRR